MEAASAAKTSVFANKRGVTGQKVLIFTTGPTNQEAANIFR